MSNVVSIEKQPAPGARFKIAAEIDGFPVEIEFEGKSDNLKSLVERLKAIGATPPQSKPAVSKANPPTCPVHHSKMKPSRKPGTFYCPRRDADGDYCQEKA